MSAAVYGLRCLVTDEIYVGSGINWHGRTRRHVARLRKGTSIHKHLQECWNKYGEKNFEVVLLRACFDYDHEKMWLLEKFYMKKFKKKLLNSHPGAIANYYIHGMTGTRTFKSWESMLQRCTNKNAPDYPRYGGAGIKVCKRWLKFANFLADMGERPNDTSLDRHPNKAGNYEPGNCRWATSFEQQRNVKSNLYIEYEGKQWLSVDLAEAKDIPVDLLRKRYHAGKRGDELFVPSYSRYKGDGRIAKRQRRETRNIKKLTFKGKTLSINEWAKELGLNRSAIEQRVFKYDMPLEKALVPGTLKKGKIGPRIGFKLLTAFGRAQSLSAWAREYNLPLSTLKNRLYRAKMPIEKALKPS